MNEPPFNPAAGMDDQQVEHDLIQAEHVNYPYDQQRLNKILVKVESSTSTDAAKWIHRLEDRLNNALDVSHNLEHASIEIRVRLQAAEDKIAKMNLLIQDLNDKITALGRAAGLYDSDNPFISTTDSIN